MPTAAQAWATLPVSASTERKARCFAGSNPSSRARRTGGKAGSAGSPGTIASLAGAGAIRGVVPAGGSSPSSPISCGERK